MLPGRKCLLHQMCCFLTSYFNSLLPTKRNVITHLDCLLVLTITILTSEMVASPSFLIAPNFLSTGNHPHHSICCRTPAPAVGALVEQCHLLDDVHQRGRPHQPLPHSPLPHHHSKTFFFKKKPLWSSKTTFFYPTLQ